MHADAILARIRRHGCVLMLDFDGTLAPIVSDPRKARMRASTHRALEIIAHRYPVAVITGRTLSDARTRVSIRRISFAGNHGLEWYARGKKHRAFMLPIFRRALGLMRSRMRSLARRYQGTSFGDEVHTFSFHYRHSSHPNHAAIRAEIRKAARETGNLRVIEGKYVSNILPAIRRNKGTAAREMYRALAGRKKPVPVFIGDDVTDEDAFRVLRKGITIRVGKFSPSAAKYYFKSRAGVDRFLRTIADTCCREKIEDRRGI